MKRHGRKIAWAAGTAVLAAFIMCSEQDSPSSPPPTAGKSPRAIALRQAKAQQAAKLASARTRLLDLAGADASSDAIKAFFADKEASAACWRLKLGDFKLLLADSSLSAEGESAEAYLALCGGYIIENGYANPDEMLAWLDEIGDSRLMFRMIGIIGCFSPDRALALISKHRNPEDPNAADLAVEILFSGLASRDPLRGLEIAASLEDPGIKRQAIGKLTNHLDTEILPPDQWNSMFALFTVEDLDFHRKEFAPLGAHLSYLPLAAVLEKYPLQPDTWQEAVACRYLRSRAGTHPAEVLQFLNSEASANLPQNDRDMLTPRCVPLYGNR